MNVLRPHLQTTSATLVAPGKRHRKAAGIIEGDGKTIRKYLEQFAAAQAKLPTVPIGSALQIPPPCPSTKGSHPADHWQHVRTTNLIESRLHQYASHEPHAQRPVAPDLNRDDVQADLSDLADLPEEKKLISF